MSTEPDDGNALELSLTLNAPRDKIWRCWTEPELLKQWFCPKPWSVARADIDVRPGGRSNITMCGPNGEEIENHGTYLEVIPGEKVVFTDAFTEGWMPVGTPFMVATVTMSDAPGGGTAYRAIARHWSAGDRERHERMGFHEGWGAAARQLEDLAKSL